MVSGCAAPPKPFPPLLPSVVSVMVSLNRVAQMTDPATRMRPQTRGMAAPSEAPTSRKRSILPLSTTCEPSPSSFWSIARPTVTPTARPITAVDRPMTEPPIADPADAPTAERRMVAMPRLPDMCGCQRGQPNRATMRLDHGKDSGDSTTACPE